jgi:hypothetical protein
MQKVYHFPHENYQQYIWNAIKFHAQRLHVTTLNLKGH